MAKVGNFLFSTTANILCELGATSQVGAIMTDLGSKSVVVVTDKMLRKLGLLDNLLESLEHAGLKYTIFDDVKEDPPEKSVLELVRFAKGNQADGIVALGGGSPMDTAKLAAFLCGDTKQNISEVYGVGMCKGKRLPLVQIPTTAGTGSEVTPISIITTGENEKKGVVSPQLYCDYAVLDGELTVSVPPKVTAATGIDAMVHAVEAYTSRGKKNVLSDLLAKEALRLLGANIRRVCVDGSDRDARMAMLLGSMYAGMAFANAPVAAVHALAYPIGSHFHVPHGLSNALMLPHVLRFNSANPDADRMYAELQPFAFPDTAGGALPPGGDALAGAFDALASDLGIEQRLRQVGIHEDDLELLATEAVKQQRLLPNNPREVLLEDARALYRLAY